MAYCAFVCACDKNAHTCIFVLTLDNVAQVYKGFFHPLLKL